MDTARWDRAGSIFERVLGAAEAERPTLLDSLCGDDGELRNIVLSMLDSENSALRFEERILRRAGIVPSGDTTSEVAVDGSEAPIGPWHLVRRIGSGGMGVVWLAERADGQFEQRAALKLIKRGMDSEAVLKRFLRERQILARLDHPHIAHLLDGGITGDGRPYFAMEYVEGLPLLRWCAEHECTLEQRLDLFVEVCAAVQFAHENHVVHRDLKPSNILVTTAGTVKLLDFGIAKLLDSDDSNPETITHLQRERPMTPAYAAPEQIRGEPISEATDIYALGCVLYELLTGQRSHDFSGANDPKDVLEIIESSSPVAPSRRHVDPPPVPPRRLRGDLDTIVLTALQREPARRYPSVAALAADLGRFFRGQPISARRDSVLYRGYKFLRRHKAGLAASLLVAAMAFATFWSEWRDRFVPQPVLPGTSMAIVDFSNLSQNPEHAWLSTALTEMLSTELAMGEKVHVLPDELVRSARAGIAAPRAGGYAMNSLATLRKRLGADFILSGSYLVSAGGGEANLRLDLALQDTRTGIARATFAQSGSLADLAALVEKAGANLRERSGFAPAQLGDDQGTDRAQPPTTEVARRMAIALDALRKYDPARARDELREANTMAPGYAPAYLYLAQAWKALGYDSRALAAAQQAAAHSRGLPQWQALSIAREVAVQKADWSRAIELDRQLLALEPDNPERHLALVADLQSAGQVAAAKSALGEWRKLPGSAADPRVDLEARKVASLDGDQQAAVRFAEQALHKAQARDEVGLAAAAKVALVSSRDYLGQRDGAEAMLRDAMLDYQHIGNPHGEADAHLMLGVVRTELNQNAEALAEYQHALVIYQRIGDQLGVSNVYKNLFLVHWAQGDRDAATLAAQHAREIGEETGDLRTQAFALGMLAYMQMEEGVTDAVLDQFRAAIDLNERAGDLRQRIDAQINYSEGLRLRGELAEAGRVCEQARATSTKLEEPYYVASARLQCAAIARDANDIDRAVAELTAARTYAEHQQDAVHTADAIVILAGIALARGATPEACGELDKAAAAYAESESVVGETNARALLALCWSSVGHGAESAAAVAQARELRSRVTAQRDVFLADLALAQVPRAGEHAAAALRALAATAETRQWTVDALEARLAEWKLQAAAHAPESAALHASLEADPRAKNFPWLLARLVPARAAK